MATAPAAKGGDRAPHRLLQVAAEGQHLPLVRGVDRDRDGRTDQNVEGSRGASVDEASKHLLATIPRMSPVIPRRKGSAPRLSLAPLEERIQEITDRVDKAGDDHAERAAALEEYIKLARAHEGETWFEVGAWSEDLADSYLALGRVDDAVRTIRNATRWGCSEGAEMLCELAEKLMRSGHEAQARTLWEQARADYPDDV